MAVRTSGMSKTAESLRGLYFLGSWSKGYRVVDIYRASWGLHWLREVGLAPWL